MTARAGHIRVRLDTVGGVRQEARCRVHVAGRLVLNSCLGAESETEAAINVLAEAIAAIARAETRS